ncbi:hypothetical protein GCM10010145_11420 [Streptomyces ruber]|uniref:Uncharacterized protein n=2 Tax=Streptomyces TaxID=1883 RepID=A0A918BAA0_9ACTN|nr:hypothetical protein GCM10010145_11420 [Streptomyces ruber]
MRGTPYRTAAPVRVSRPRPTGKGRASRPAARPGPRLGSRARTPPAAGGASPPARPPHTRQPRRRRAGSHREAPLRTNSTRPTGHPTPRYPYPAGRPPAGPPAPHSDSHVEDVKGFTARRPLRERTAPNPPAPRTAPQHMHRTHRCRPHVPPDSPPHTPATT